MIPPSPHIRSYFRGRTLWIATMHGKETVIQPSLQPLEVEFGIPNLDTDQLGTFSRERERPADQRTTARLKAELALTSSGGDLAVATEGSFAPHPALPWLPMHRELVLLLDRRHDLEIVGEVVANQTNYAHSTPKDWPTAEAFARRVGFPEHGLILMPRAQPQPGDPVFKGIRDWSELERLVEQGLRDWGSLHLETDMRAHHNPTRMEVIAQACQQLLTKLSHACPQCGIPGYSPTQSLSGLPCADCGAPTPVRRAVLWRCQKCDYTEKQLFPDQRQLADPGDCPLCNP
ncbi:MAG: hypothetical protein OHK0012_17000 [Synechococcales cyanobacterium]